MLQIDESFAAAVGCDGREGLVVRTSICKRTQHERVSRAKLVVEAQYSFCDARGVRLKLSSVVA
jgi:hypothetical protein